MNLRCSRRRGIQPDIHRHLPAVRLLWDASSRLRFDRASRAFETPLMSCLANTRTASLSMLMPRCHRRQTVAMHIGKPDRQSRHVRHLPSTVLPAVCYGSHRKPVRPPRHSRQCPSRSAPYSRQPQGHQAAIGLSGRFERQRWKSVTLRQPPGAPSICAAGASGHPSAVRRPEADDGEGCDNPGNEARVQE